jgi:autotransporter-associated beta strand protein
MTPLNFTAAIIGFALVTSASHAASGTWLAVPTSDNWNTAANWDPSNPGTGNDITNAGSTDIATFSADSTITTINLGAARSLGGFYFDTTSASAYAIAGGVTTNRFLLTRGMTSQITATVTNTQTLATRLRIAAGIVGTESIYTFQNDAASSDAAFVMSGEILNLASTAAAMILRGSNTGTNTVSGAIGEFDALSALSLIKEDDGSWILSGSNTYTRGTWINNGLLTVANKDALGSGAVTITNGSLLARDGVTNTNAITVGVAAGFATNWAPSKLAGWNMAGVNSNTPSLAPSTLPAGVTGVDMLRGSGVTASAAPGFGGSGWFFPDAASSIASNRFLTFGLSASDPNTILRFSSLSPFYYSASGAGPTNATLQFSTNGGTSFADVFTTNGFARTNAGLFAPIDVSAGGTVLQSVGTNGVIFRWVNFGASTNAGNFVIRDGLSASDDLVLNGEIGTIVSNAVSGTGTIGIGQAGAARFRGDMTINSTATLTASADGTATFSGAIGGAGALLKGGTGRVTLTESNSYSGGTTVGTGMLTIADDNALGTGLVTINGGTLANSSGAGKTIPNNLVFRGNATMGGAPGGASLTINGTTDLGGATRTIAMSNSVNFAGPVINGNLVVNASAGNKRLTFSSSTNFTGGLAINGGILEIGNGGTTGSLIASSVTNNAAQLVFNRSDNIAQNTVYPASPITGASLRLTQLGAGTLTLNAANTYTGNTTISNGTLVLATNGSMVFKIEDSGTNNGLIGTGTSVIAGSFIFDLSTASTNTNSTWIIVANTLSNSYGTNFFVSGFSGVAGGNWTNTTNGVSYVFAQPTGMLSVQPTGGVVPYFSWVSYWQGVDPGFTNTALAADPDGDGFNNSLEFSFDGNPTVGTPALLSATRVGNNALFRYVVRKDPPGGATYEVQKSVNLTNGVWTDAGVAVSDSPDQTGINIPADYVRKEFSVPATGAGFYRVKATVVP